MEALRSVTKLVLVAVFALTVLVHADRAAAASTPNDYRIRVGDTVSITVYGEATLTQAAVRVLPGGYVSMPLAGDILIAGLTPYDASSAIANALARYLRYPKVTVAVTTPGPVDVLVLGNVKLPGKYSLQAESHLTDAIAAAGGLGVTDGPLPNARLQAADGRVEEVSLQRLLQQGDVSLNLALQNEMTIYVISPLALNVQVWGAVDHPGDVALHEGDRLIAAIARAGASSASNPDLNHVQVRRVQTDGTVRSYAVNIYEVLKSRDISRDLILQKGDIVYVPQAAKKQDFSGMMSSALFWLLPRP
jgi:polysaccharide export outer membrane protein